MRTFVSHNSTIFIAELYLVSIPAVVTFYTMRDGYILSDIVIYYCHQCIFFVQVYLNVSEDCHMYLDIFKCISTYSKLPNVSQYISLPKTSLELFLLRCFHCQSVPSHLMISTRKIVLGTKKKKSFVHNCPTSKDFLSSFSLSTLPLTTTKTRRRKNDTTK